MNEADSPNIIMMPPMAGVISIVATLILQLIYAPWWIPGFPSFFMIGLGLLLVVVGFSIGHSATTVFDEAGTNVDPSKPALIIVDQGPYRYTRNPMYVGLLLVHLGLGLIGSLDWVLITTPALWLFLHFGVVLREESYLTNKFGEDYTQLLSKTRRWI